MSESESTENTYTDVVLSVHALHDVVIAETEIMRRVLALETSPEKGG